MSGYQPLRGDDPEEQRAMNSATVVPTGHEAVVKDARRKRLTTTKMDSPVWYLLKASLIYVLVLCDVYINSAVNSTSFSGAVGMQLGSFWPFLFLVVQASLQLFVFLTLFLLMCNTYLMQIGLPSAVLADFRWLGIAQANYLLLTLVLGAMRALHYDQVSSSTTVSFIWTMDGYEVVFVLQNLSAAFYYHQVLYSTFRLANEKYYTRADGIDLREG